MNTAYSPKIVSDTAQSMQTQQRCKFLVKYLGSAQLNKNFTMPMLEWIARDIRRQTIKSTNQRQFKIPAREIVFQVHNLSLSAYLCKDGLCVFVHPMQYVTKFAQLQHDKTCFAYLMRDSKDSPTTCHLFQAKNVLKVQEIFVAIRNAASPNHDTQAPIVIKPSTSTSTSAANSPVTSRANQEQQQLTANNLSEGGHKSLPTTPLLAKSRKFTTQPTNQNSTIVVDSDTTFEENSYQFEVMFVKKLKLQVRRVPSSFVDDALETLKSFEVLKSSGEPKVSSHHAKIGPNIITGRRVISASVDERQEYDEICQSPGPPVNQSQHSNDESNKQDSSVSNLTQTNSSLCPPKSQHDHQQQSAGKQYQSLECLKTIDLSNVNDIASISRQAAQANGSSINKEFGCDFLPYKTIVSSDLNKRLAAIPTVAGSSVSLDQETRQSLARRVRETLMAGTSSSPSKSSEQPSTIDENCSSKDDSTPACSNDDQVHSLDVPNSESKEQQALESTQDCQISKQTTASRRASDSPNRLDTKQSSKSLTQTNKQPSTNNFDLFRRSSAKQVVRNRTMLLLIGKTDLCAISIDKHQVLFSKSFNSIVHCLQGLENKDHFGLICRDSVRINPNSDSYFGFVFKCQSEKVVREIMSALKQVIYSSHYNCNAPSSPYNPLVSAGNKPKYPTQMISLANLPLPELEPLNSRPAIDTVNQASQYSSTNTSNFDQQASSDSSKQESSSSSSASSSSSPTKLQQRLVSRSFDDSSLPSSTSTSVFDKLPLVKQLSITTNSANKQLIGTDKKEPANTNSVSSMFCDDCPLYWFHRLCCDVEFLPKEACKTIILRRIESSTLSNLMTTDEQDQVLSKFSDYDVETIDEHNEIFMSLLRLLCEKKQMRHNSSQLHQKNLALKAKQRLEMNLNIEKANKHQQQQLSLVPYKQQNAPISTHQQAIPIKTNSSTKSFINDNTKSAVTTISAHLQTVSDNINSKDNQSFGENTQLTVTQSNQYNQHQQRNLLNAGSTLSLASSTSSQCLADASSIAIDNLKKAKNSISCSIENLLRRRRLSMHDDAYDTDTDIGSNSPPIIPAVRSESFRERSRQSRAENNQTINISNSNSIFFNINQNNNMQQQKQQQESKRSNSIASDDDNNSKSISGSSNSLSAWTNSLSKTISGGDIAGMFRRRSLTLGNSELSDNENYQNDNNQQQTRPLSSSLLNKLGVSTESFGRIKFTTTNSPLSPEVKANETKTTGATQRSASPMLSGSFWRKNIFNKIRINQTSDYNEQNNQLSSDTSQLDPPFDGNVPINSSLPTTSASCAKQKPISQGEEEDCLGCNRKKKSKQEIRELWARAINEQITLIRMEKQNQKLAAIASARIGRKMNQDANIKLSYREIPFNKEAIFKWQRLLMQDAILKVDFNSVVKHVKLGIPKQLRGEVWMFLMNQYQIRHGSSFQTTADYNGDANQAYKSLLSQLSLQQHEIFVDLGKYEY